MNLSRFIKKLEKKGIVSRKPRPIIPFILFLVIITFGVATFYFNINKFFSYAFFILATFTFVFAILHYIVVRILENK